jgi:hypothetical protein
MADDTQDRMEVIRARAYQLWLDEGCPTGREQEHWSRATELVVAEERAEQPRQSGEETSVIAEIAAGLAPPSAPRAADGDTVSSGRSTPRRSTARR